MLVESTMSIVLVSDPPESPATKRNEQEPCDENKAVEMEQEEEEGEAGDDEEAQKVTGPPDDSDEDPDWAVNKIATPRWSHKLITKAARKQLPPMPSKSKQLTGLDQPQEQQGDDTSGKQELEPLVEEEQEEKGEKKEEVAVDGDRRTRAKSERVAVLKEVRCKNKQCYKCRQEFETPEKCAQHR